MPDPEPSTTTETQAAAASAETAPAPEPSKPDKGSPVDDRSALVRMDAENKAKVADAAQTEPSEPSETEPGDGKETAAETETREALSDAMAEAGPEELSRLQELAKRLGYVVDDRKIWGKERADFREHQRKQRAALEQAKQQAIAEVEQLRTQHQADIDKASAILAAFEAGNYDEFARLTGHKSWEDMQHAVIQRVADPNYKRLQELERAMQEQKEREAKAREEYQRQQQLLQAQENERRYLNKLSQQMAASKDPLVQVLAEDPNALRVIAKVQEDHWDPDERRTVSPERAIQLAGLDKQIRTMYERWHKALGGGSEATQQPSAAQQPAQSAASAPAKPKAKTNKTQIVKGPPVEAAPAAEWKDDKDFIKYAMEKMKSAAAQERSEQT